ncbi:histidine phosphatase family protein [uncultured Amnibacterium sp.]|uniref:histidine phosphatase family protein n=1 Tax=uncultured Amnibacterium sp. TaxID=1631851 RepID=UPI0035CA9512
MARLILVRHGQTRSNVHGLLDTAAPGPGLTDLGREQAAALVQVLAGEAIDRVVASPLTRTVETAAPLAAARGLPLLQDAGLREVLAGDLEMLADHDSHRAYLGAVFSWATGDLAARMPGDPESGADFFARYDAAVEAATAGVGTVVCVSHGASIRTWAGSRASNVDREFGAAHGLPNTGVVTLDRQGDGLWRVDTWTDFRFPPALDDDPTGAPVA